MTTLILYLFAAFGLAYIVGFSTLSRPVRELLAIYALGTDGGRTYPAALFVLNLIECPMCFGWWTGLAAGVAVGLAAPWWWNGPVWLPALLLPFATAGSNLMLGTYAGIVDLRTHQPEEK